MHPSLVLLQENENLPSLKQQSKGTSIRRCSCVIPSFKLHILFLLFQFAICLPCPHWRTSQKGERNLKKSDFTTFKPPILDHASVIQTARNTKEEWSAEFFHLYWTEISDCHRQSLPAQCITGSQLPQGLFVNKKQGHCFLSHLATVLLCSLCREPGALLTQEKLVTCPACARKLSHTQLICSYTRTLWSLMTF